LWCAPGFIKFIGKSAPLFVEKETAQFFGLVRQGCENVALKSHLVADFPGLFGFFLLIMITLGAKTINACEIAGFPTTLYRGLRLGFPTATALGDYEDPG
jgi:hypothetical protein